MRILVVTVWCVSFAFSQQPAQTMVSDLQWLTGLWGIEQGDRTGEEFWQPLIKERLEGKSIMRTKGRITLQERMVIEKDTAGTINYRVYSGGQRPVSFKLVRSGPGTAVFENRKNAFPQRIIYEQVTEDSLRATIDGLVKGKLQTVVFPFRRVIVNAD